MGTRGYVIIKINNKYYAYCNSYDSMPRRLGRDLLDNLREINYEEYKEKLKTLETSEEEQDWMDLEDILDDGVLYNEVPGAEDNPDDIHYNPVAENLYRDVFIEYVYKFDFDNDEFEMYCFWSKFRMLANMKDMDFVEKVFDMFDKKC